MLYDRKTNIVMGTPAEIKEFLQEDNTELPKLPKAVKNAPQAKKQEEKEAAKKKEYTRKIAERVADKKQAPQKKKKGRKLKSWTWREEQLLRLSYKQGTPTVEELAKKFNRSKGSIYVKANKMGLKREQ